MRFYLIDTIEQLTDTRIVASKNVSLAEEYLADHFPTFPVLPGVMMLEAATQAAAWLLHKRREFSCSMAVLKEARNVKYGQFVSPGDVLKIEAEFVRDTSAGAMFKVAGFTREKQSIAARIELAYFNLAQRDAALAETDAKLLAHTRQRWALVSPAPTLAI